MSYSSLPTSMLFIKGTFTAEHLWLIQDILEFCNLKSKNIVRDVYIRHDKFTAY